MSVEALVRPAAPVTLDERAVWTLDDVASYLRLSRRKVDYLRKQKDFPRSCAFGGGYPRFKAGHIMAWVEEQLCEAA